MVVVLVGPGEVCMPSAPKNIDKPPFAIASTSSKIIIIYWRKCAAEINFCFFFVVVVLKPLSVVRLCVLSQRLLYTLTTTIVIK